MKHLNYCRTETSILDLERQMGILAPPLCILTLKLQFSSLLRSSLGGLGGLTTAREDLVQGESWSVINMSAEPLQGSSGRNANVRTR